MSNSRKPSIFGPARVVVSQALQKAGEKEFRKEHPQGPPNSPTSESPSKPSFTTTSTSPSTTTSTPPKPRSPANS